MVEEKKYKVSITTELNNLGSVINKINEAISNGQVKLNKSLNDKFEKLKINYQNLFETIGKGSETTSFGSGVYKKWVSELKEIAKVTKEIGINLLPKETSEEIQKTTNRLEELQKQLKNLQGQTRRRESYITEDGASLTDKKQQEVFIKSDGTKLDTGGENKFSTIEDVEDKRVDVKSQIQQIEKLIESKKSQEKQDKSTKEEIKNLNSQLAKLKSTEKEYTDFINTFNSACEEKISEIKKEIEERKNKIQTIKDEIAAEKKLINLQLSKSGQGSKAEQESAQALSQLGIDPTEVIRATSEVQENAIRTQEEYNNAVAEEEKVAKKAAEEEKKRQQEKRRAEQEQKKANQEAKKQIEEFDKNLKDATNGTDEFSKSLTKNATRVVAFGSAVSFLRNIMRQSITTVKELDKAFTNMAIVTSMSRKEAWQLKSTMEDLANATSKTTSEVTQITTMYLQQGKSISQAIMLTEATARAATIAGISGTDSVNLLTNAMNGFQLSASKAMEVSDKFAALAASSATNYEELATALSKVASQANLAGMSMDFTLGLLAKGIETTREAPETIGTALKTVISRMRELTDYGSTLEDGMDVNRVEKALSNVGVALRDEQGMFRDLDKVLTELGTKWDTLNKNQQANVAVALAGTRQQSRLIAMMQDFDRTLELVDESANSYGATIYQSGKYAEGLEASITRLTNSWQKLTSNIVNSDAVVNFIDFLNNVVSEVADSIDKFIIPGAVLLVGLSVSLLNNGLARLATARQEKLLKDQNLILESKASLEAKRKTTEQKYQVKLDAKALLNEQKSLVINKKQTLEEIRRNKQIAKRNGNTAELARLTTEEATVQQELSKAELDYQEAKEVYKESDLEYQKSKIELMNTSFGIAQAETDQIPLIGSGLSNVLGILFSITSIMSTIPGINKLIQLGIDKIIKKKKEEQGVELGTVALNSASNLAKNIPIYGVIAAAAILALVGLGAGIAAIINSTAKQNKSIENTTESLEKQQSQFYELNKSISTVSKLGNEFDKLSNKIIKTTDDLDKLNEISQQINDEAGRAVVDTAADLETQQKQIASYVTSLELDKGKALKEQRETLANPFIKFNNLFQGRLPIEAAKRYIEALGDAGKATLRTLGNSLIKSMGDYSSEAVEIMTNAYVQFAPEMLIKGFDENLFVNQFADALDKINSAIESESLIEYYNALSAIDEKTRDVILSSNEYLNGLYKLGSADLLQQMDKLGISIDSMSSFFQILKKTTGETGDALYNTFTKEVGSAIKSATGDLEEFKRSLYTVQVAAVKQRAEEVKKDAATELPKVQKKIQELTNKYNNESNEDKKLSIAGEIKTLQDQEEMYGNTDAWVKEQIQELTNLLLDRTPINTYIDNASKASSALEKFIEINESGKLTLSDQIDLMERYPELFGSIEKGALDVGKAYEILQKDFNDNLKAAEDGIKDLQTYYDNNNTLLAGTNITVEMFSTDKNQAQKLIDIYQKGLDNFYAANENVAKSTLDSIWGNIAEFVQTYFLYEQMETKGLSYSLELEIDYDSFSNARKQISSTIELLTTEIDLLEQGSDDYNEKITKLFDTYYRGIKLLSEKYDADGTSLRNLFGSISDEDYAAIKGVFEIIGESVVIDQEAYDKLSEKQKSYFNIGYNYLEDYAAEQKAIYDERLEYAQAIAEKEIEVQVAELEKKQQLYEDYWSKLDAIDTEREREQDRQSILNQLSALAGGSGNAAKSLQKDLLSQLEDLNKEQIEAQKQAQRDALTAKLDTQLEELNNSVGVLTQAILSSPKELKDVMGEFFGKVGIPQNKNGGLVDYTGLAWVDGTKTNPEAFLNSAQTALIAQLVRTLSSNDIAAESLGSTSGVVIEKIEINTAQLNNTQDFREAGTALGEEFAAAAKRRGLNINVKR